jgi:hypothetical protein
MSSSDVVFSPTRTTAHTLPSSLCSGTYTTINCDETEQGQEMAKRDSGLRGDKGLSTAQFELQQFLGEFARSSKAPINFMSVRPSVSISTALTGRISLKFDTGDFH